MFVIACIALSCTIIELIVKQRDVYKTSSLLVTHRLQDAFIMATHYFDRKTNHMEHMPQGMHCEVPMNFLILRDSKVIFDGQKRASTPTRAQAPQSGSTAPVHPQAW